MPMSVELPHVFSRLCRVRSVGAYERRWCDKRPQNANYTAYHTAIYWPTGPANNHRSMVISNCLTTYHIVNNDRFTLCTICWVSSSSRRNVEMWPVLCWPILPSASWPGIVRVACYQCCMLSESAAGRYHAMPFRKFRAVRRWTDEAHQLRIGIMQTRRCLFRICSVAHRNKHESQTEHIPKHTHECGPCHARMCTQKIYISVIMVQWLFFSCSLSRCICPTHRLSFRTHKCSTAERLIVISVVMNRVCSADTTSAPLLGACSEYTSSKSIAQLVFAMCNVQCSH